MTLTPVVLLVLVMAGAGIGMVSGMLGIGGAIMIIPILVLIFHFPQKLAAGTSLGMLTLPVALFSAIEYYRAGNMDWRVSLIMAAGFTAGAWFGARLVNSGKMPEDALRFMFSFLLLYVAGRLLFRSDGRAMAALKTCGLILVYFASYVAMRLLARRWEKMPYWPSVYQDRRKQPISHDYEI